MSKKELKSADRDYEQLLNKILERSETGIKEASAAVGKSQLATYWDNGRYIVEYEQNGKPHAEYGLELLKRLSLDLTLRKGKGFSRPTLYKMRKFYQCYPSGYDECINLSWSHVCELITIEDELERSFYAKECAKEHWNVRTLMRQKDSGLFLRLASSKDKQGILDLANNGIEIQSAEDIIKDTYTLEFLNMRDSRNYDESELEEKIITHLQEFLLELGKGFTFVKRQYPMNIGNKIYKCDLVFYHRILKCFVLIDLKKGAVRHEDIGQMNTYMGYIAEEENMPDDNPPVGIILAREKDELLIKYATYGMEDSNLFVSKYELYLPNKDELRQLVDNIIKDENLNAE